MKFHITLFNKHVIFLMIQLKATSSCSRLHVGLVILCCYETPWRWQLCAETCSSWHCAWSVFCDSCFIVFYWVHFVGWYIECKEIHDMNNVISVNNSPCDTPHGWWLSGRQPLCCITHVQHCIAHWVLRVRTVLVASYVHNSTLVTVWQTHTGCVRQAAYWQGQYIG